MVQWYTPVGMQRRDSVMDQQQQQLCHSFLVIGYNYSTISSSSIEH